MGKRKMSQAAIRNEIALLTIKKRNGLIQAIAAFAGMIVIIVLKIYLEGINFPWASGYVGSIAIWVIAIIAAAIAGMGTRSWRKAKDQIKRLSTQLK